MRFPGNYFGSTFTTRRPCEACGEPITVNKKSPAIYGAGRFCSENCSKLRDPDKHLKWLLDHPEEYQAWLERKQEREKEGPKKEYEIPL